MIIVNVPQAMAHDRFAAAKIQRDENKRTEEAYRWELAELDAVMPSPAAANLAAAQYEQVERCRARAGILFAEGDYDAVHRSREIAFAIIREGPRDWRAGKGRTAAVMCAAAYY